MSKHSEGFPLVPIGDYPRQDSNRSTEQPEPATGYGKQSNAPGTKSGTMDARDAAFERLAALWPALSDETVAALVALAEGESRSRAAHNS
ncbi:MAG: hypothetical protein O2820_15385 [Planctomycetota bacterium]|nr:hypothetical protein [Planctomycetota bacterium]